MNLNHYFTPFQRRAMDFQLRAAERQALSAGRRVSWLADEGLRL